MDVKEILKHVDHTLLLQPSTWEEIKQICDDAMEYGTASVCIPPSYVKQAAEYMNGKMAVCTVIGFPNGYMTTAAKEFETKDALANGASEIDMVINIPKNLTKRELDNGYKIRRAAVDYNIPLLTNARLASAFIYAICKVDRKDIAIKSWDEYRQDEYFVD